MSKQELNQRWSRNTEGLKIAQQQRRLETFAKAEAGIKQLLQDGKPITFEAVAEAGNVSRAWLYRQPDLKQRIEDLRHHSPRVQATSGQKASEASKEVMLAALRQQVRELRAEKQELTRQIEVAYGLVQDAKQAYLVTENRHLVGKLEQAQIRLNASIHEHQYQCEEIVQLNLQNKELKAQMIGMKSLESELEDLKKQNQRLFNRITQTEANTCSRSTKQIVQSRNEVDGQQELPKVEF
jgi:Family of unknown function (DUF6262)